MTVPISVARAGFGMATRMGADGRPCNRDDRIGGHLDCIRHYPLADSCDDRRGKGGHRWSAGTG